LLNHHRTAELENPQYDQEQNGRNQREFDSGCATSLLSSLGSSHLIGAFIADVWAICDTKPTLLCDFLMGEDILLMYSFANADSAT